jgi:hypothetical protein
MIEEMIAAKLGEFRELEVPEVNKITLKNDGGSPVFMIDGEEITGAMQNRIIASSTIAEARSSRNIPVVCAEEGRWDELGGFKTGHCSYPRIRTILAQSKHADLDTQKTIWAEIARKIAVTRTTSRTSSMHDVYETLDDEIARYIEGFEGIDHGTVGIIGSAGTKILGCDIFQTPALYKKFENKLLRGYALDAIEYQKERGTPRLEKFFEGIGNMTAELSSAPPRSRMKNVPLKQRGLIGQALIYDKRLFHLSAFPVS